MNPCICWIWPFNATWQRFCCQAEHIASQCHLLVTVVKEDHRHVIWVRQIGRWTEASEFEEVINRLGISSYRCRPKNLLVIVVDATLDVLDIDGYNPYETFIVSTWI